MFLNEFIKRYREGTLDTNAAWRAYDLPASVKPLYVRRALKVIGMRYAGELGIPQFCAHYGVAPDQAETLLGSWWLLREIEAGGHPRGLALRTAKAG